MFANGSLSKNLGLLPIMDQNKLFKLGIRVSAGIMVYGISGV